MQPDAGINIKDVVHSFERSRLVLDHVSISVPRGRILALLGPSGCGKTTLLRAGAGLLRLNEGLITLDGTVPDLVRQRGQIGFAFQSSTLLPWRTALQNVMLPLELVSNGDTNPEAHAQDLLEQVGLADAIHKLPRELSGGMQQRVGLARALSTRPNFLFLDEPFGALDGITRERLNIQLHALCRRYGLTTMIVTHSIEEAVFLADTIVVLSPAPTRVTETIDIELGEQRDFNTRALDAYFDYGKRLRSSIQEEVR